MKLRCGGSPTAPAKFICTAKSTSISSTTRPATAAADEETLYQGFDDDNMRLAAGGGIYSNSINPIATTAAFRNNLYYFPPQQDQPYYNVDINASIRVKNTNFDMFSSYRFGSAHAGTLNMAFCDGSVHPITYEVAPSVHAQLADRMDGVTVDPSQYLGD